MLPFAVRSAPAQGFDATSLRQPTDLAAGWLVHGGDDPAYARPDFDDSHWTPFNAETGSLHTIFPNSQPEIVWYRLHIKLAPDEHNLSLHAQLPGVYEIYVSGTRLAAAGSFSPYVPCSSWAHQLIPIPDSQFAGGSLLVALRMHIDRVAWDNPQPGFVASELTIGQVEGMREHMWYLIAGRSALDWLDDLVTVGLMLGALLLYSTQRNRPEYLWLFLWTAINVPPTFLARYSLFHTFPARWYIVSMLYVLWPYLTTKMYCAFVGHRIGWRLNLFVILESIGHAVYYWNLAFGAPSYNMQVLIEGSIALLYVAILPWILIADMRRGRRETAFLLIPLMLGGLWYAGMTICSFLIQIPPLRDLAAVLFRRLAGTYLGPFGVSYLTVTDILSMFSLALIILIRSNRMSRQQGVLELEMASAREVQNVILPEAIEFIPGFRIESVYEPASEVGGDFFQILPVGEGGLLLVIGDVAGKGLPAAMLVSVLVGAIRTAAQYDHSPAMVLGQLNQRLIGRTKGGFSTALIALIAADGAVTISSAGHLPPYLDGKEVELPGALPLGIDRSAVYEVIGIELEPGSRLTFYTDGVVEAQDKTGQLFGFDRARELSTRPVAAIAQAAKAFGQQDDITVIAVERAAADVKPDVQQAATAWVPS